MIGGTQIERPPRGGLSKIQYGSLLPFFHNGGHPRRDASITTDEHRPVRPYYCEHVSCANTEQQYAVSCL